MKDNYVVCDQVNKCDESHMCGGAKPHLYREEECGKCVMILGAKCIKVEDIPNISNKYGQ